VANDLREQIRRISRESGVPARRMVEVDQRIQGLIEFRTIQAALRSVEMEARARVREGRFAQAHAAAAGFQTGGLGELEARRVALVTEIGTASRQAWSDLLQAGKTRRPVTIEAWAEDLRDLEAALVEERFVPEPALREERIKVGRYARQAKKIAAAIAGFDQTYSDELFGAALESVSFSETRRQLRKAGVVVENKGKAWGGTNWYDEEARFEIVPMLRSRVGLRLERLHELVQSAWDRLVEKTEPMRVPARIENALTLLRAFESQLVLGEYPSDLQDAAVRYIRVLQGEALQFDEDRAKVLYGTARAVLAAVLAGDEEAVRRAVQKGVDETLAGDGQRERVRALSAAADAVASVRAGALAYLRAKAAPRRSLGRVRMRDGGTFDNWRLDRVTADGRLVSRWEGQRREAEQGLEDFHLSQQLAWAKDAGPGRPPALHVVISELALLPNEKFEAVSDLLVVQVGLENILEALRPKYATSSWDEVATHWGRLVDSEQEDRERDAVRAFRNIEKHHHSGFFLQVVELGELYLDPDGRIWFTRTRIKNEARVRKLLAHARKEIERNEMQQWLRGVRVKPLDEPRAELTFDFNVQEVAERFLFGYFQFVDQPRARSMAPAITPRERSDDAVREQRLRLLPEVKGLKRGWPLGLENIFETSEEISVEFDLFTLADGCFLLGVDIDGVQLVVWSADPNWYRDAWKLPEALRTDPTQDLIWYGRGRGVATHMGPGFGNIPGTGWEFHDHQSGKYYPKWAGKQRELETGDRFAFRRGRNYRVRVVRKLDEIRLLQAPLDDWQTQGAGAFIEVFRQKDPRWSKVGKDSERQLMSRGSGRIQILSWNTVEIDNLVLAGHVRPSWREEQKAK
jgi:hypothetical protein